MDLPVIQKRVAIFFFLGSPSSMTDPSASTCGGGAGGGLCADVLSATLFDVDFEGWRARLLMSVEGKGGMLLVSLWAMVDLLC